MLVPLVVRSSYSLGRGVVAPGEWAAAAKAAGLSRIALSDRNGLYGIPAFVEACEKAGLRPIIGTELFYSGGRALLIAGTKAGFSAISRLLTARAANLGAFDARAAIASSLGEAMPGDLFVLSDDEVLLGGQCDREALFALVTQCNRAVWRPPRPASSIPGSVRSSVSSAPSTASGASTMSRKPNSIRPRLFWVLP